MTPLTAQHDKPCSSHDQALVLCQAKGCTAHHCITSDSNTLLSLGSNNARVAASLARSYLWPLFSQLAFLIDGTSEHSKPCATKGVHFNPKEDPKNSSIHSTQKCSSHTQTCSSHEKWSMTPGLTFWILDPGHTPRELKMATTATGSVAEVMAPKAMARDQSHSYRGTVARPERSEDTANGMQILHACRSDCRCPQTFCRYVTYHMHGDGDEYGC